MCYYKKESSFQPIQIRSSYMERKMKKNLFVVVRSALLFLLFLWVCSALFVLGSRAGNIGYVYLAFVASSVLWFAVFWIGIILLLQARNSENNSTNNTGLTFMDYFWITMCIGAGLIVNTLFLRLVCWFSNVSFPL
jgi:hypothetical protein